LTKVDAASFLGELGTGGIPRASLKTLEHNVSRLRDAGDDYLNVMFGWAPTVSDLKKLAKLVVDHTEAIRQWNRDAKRVVRRRWSFPPEVTVTTQLMPDNRSAFGGSNSYIDLYGNVAGNIVRERVVTRNVWFSGAFQYFTTISLDKAKDGLGKYVAYAQNLLSVLNLEPDPDTLWELAPWSWAVDWFSNVGDVMSNISSFQNDGVIMRYGYLMEHTIVVDTYTRRFPYDTLQNVKAGTGAGNFSSFSLITETKKRTQANPFGFGVNWSGLSPRQLSIVAALGISRSS